MLFRSQQRQIAAEVIIGFLSKYCYFVPEHSLNLLKKIDESTDADLERVGRAIT